MTDISAFGVIHKSYNKLRPKLMNALTNMGPEPDAVRTMEGRTRWNYAMARTHLGDNGRAGARAAAKVKRHGSVHGATPERILANTKRKAAESESRAFMDASMKGAQNIERRKKLKKLP